MSASELIPEALLTLPEARRFTFRDEDDSSRDGLLVDAVNYASAAIAEHCERELVDTTVPSQSGEDGVTNGTTTFTAASAAFTVADEGSLIEITTKGEFRIATVTSGTEVELDGSPSAGTTLAWRLGEARRSALRRQFIDGLPVGWIDLVPYDLRVVSRITLYSERDAADHRVLTSDEYELRPIGGAAGGTYLGILTIAPTLSQRQAGFGWQATVEGFWGMAAIPQNVKLACSQWVENLMKNPGDFASQAMAGYTVVPGVELGLRAGMPASVRHRLKRYTRVI